ncbi:hypothetical protein ACU4GD_11495 [Cupriavidus basilensis]
MLSTLINNNNGNGSPQWFMVVPQQVDRIDVMYGPFSAAYPGNSYGAVTGNHHADAEGLRRQPGSHGRRAAFRQIRHQRE